MVIDDRDPQSGSFTGKKSTDNAPETHAPGGAHKAQPDAFALASPLDHLAAFVADLVLFVPLVTFALASLRREITVAQIAGETNRYIGFMIAAGFILILGAVLYQTVFIAIWGQTPGKRVLRLRVISIWGERISWGSALLRAIFWCFGIACVGLPWLSIFSDQRRRMLHDKVAETMVVVDDKTRAVFAPTLWEQSIISGFRSATIVFGLLIALQSGTKFWKHQTLTEKLFDDGKPAEALCEEITSAMPGWMGHENVSRINVALSLYAADRIQDDCLDKEAEHGFLQDKDIESSYVAKALLHQDDGKISERYQKKVCGNDPQGAGCRLLSWIEDVHLSGSITTRPEDPDYLKIWAIRANQERHQTSEALALLSQPAPHLELAYFFASNRLQALRDLNQGSIAQVQFKSVLDGLNRDERWDLARDACSAETTLGCASQLTGCETLIGLAQRDPQAAESADPELARALLRGARCSSEPARALSELKADFDDGEARSSAMIEMALVQGDMKTAHRLSHSLADSDEVSPLGIEALASFVQTSTTPDQLHKAFETWADIDDDGAAWRALGWQLAQAYLRFHKPEQTLRIGDKLMESGFSPPELQKNMVIAAFEKGYDDEAKSFLTMFKDSPGEDLGLQLNGQAPRSARGPASISSATLANDRDARFDKAVHALQASKATGEDLK